MSFTPISGGLSSALSGAIVPARLVEPERFYSGSDIREDTRSEELSARRIHAPANKAESARYTILIVIISALIFVTVIALYDIMRAAITNYYANQALTNPASQNNPVDITRTQIANDNSLWAAMVFGAFAVLSAIILIIIILRFI